MPADNPFNYELKVKDCTYDLFPKKLKAREGLSFLTETTIDFRVDNKEFDPGEIVGREVDFYVYDHDGGVERRFAGICISLESLGHFAGTNHVVAEIRPKMWLLTRSQNCRIFQEKKTEQIVKEVLEEHGISDVNFQLSDSYEVRPYCVQYRESDYAFICRLLEEEGMYFFFDVGDGSDNKLKICDGVGAHATVSGLDKFTFMRGGNVSWAGNNNVVEWLVKERVTRGKYTLNEYDFTTPTADLKASSAIEEGTHNFKDKEHYDYPGRYQSTGTPGSKRARVRMEAEALRYKGWKLLTDVRGVAAGKIIPVTDHPTDDLNTDYLITETTHFVNALAGTTDKDAQDALTLNALEFPEEVKEVAYSNLMTLIPKDTQYRAPLVTPWPEIPSIQTATVIGQQADDEIYTDEHGRIKVVMHWDRDGRTNYIDKKYNQILACWIRVATPWSGKGWGMVAIPRVGQEVVVQFEEGNPDRPLCTGMLYNEDTKPAFKYPDNKTELGIRTNSSKGGEGYNELMFDDKKGSEMMRVQAEKDHQFLIKNKSVRAIGLTADEFKNHKFENDADENLSQVVKNTVDEHILEGDHILNIDKGDQTFTIKQGDVSVKASSGKITMEAAKEILLKVGGSSIKIDQQSVTITTQMVKIKGNMTTTVEGGISTTVKGGAMLTLKGGTTMIN